MPTSEGLKSLRNHRAVRGLTDMSEDQVIAAASERLRLQRVEVDSGSQFWITRRRIPRPGLELCDTNA